jgi:hypothetical protein
MMTFFKRQKPGTGVKSHPVAGPRTCSWMKTRQQCWTSKAATAGIPRFGIAPNASRGFQPRVQNGREERAIGLRRFRWRIPFLLRRESITARTRRRQHTPDSKADQASGIPRKADPASRERASADSVQRLRLGNAGCQTRRMEEHHGHRTESRIRRNRRETPSPSGVTSPAARLLRLFLRIHRTIPMVPVPMSDIGAAALAIAEVAKLGQTAEGQKVIADIRTVNLTLVHLIEHLLGKDGPATPTAK